MYTCVLDGDDVVWLLLLMLVMAHIWNSLVTHMKQSCHTCEWIMSHIWMSHNAHMNATCLTHVGVCAMSCWCVCHDSLIYVTHSYMWHDSLTCVICLIHVCGTTHSYVWHVSFICATKIIHMCQMTHSYVWHDSFICVTRLNHVWKMQFSNVWHDAFTHAITALAGWLAATVCWWFVTHILLHNSWLVLWVKSVTRIIIYSLWLEY